MNGSAMLRGWREREGLSVNAAAKRLDVGWKELVLWERPDSGRCPGLRAAVRLHRICGIPPDAWVAVDAA